LFLIAVSPALLLAQAGASVPLVSVVARPMSGATTLPGELRAFRAVDIYGRVSGFVESVEVDRGSRVRKGDLLATVTAPELIAQIAEAQARVVAVEAQTAEAEARRAAAESTFERLREAATTPGAVAQNEVVLAGKSLEAERARISSIGKSVEAARASVRALESIRQYLRVTAEFDGVITERLIHEGSLVGPQAKESTPMFRLLQTDRLRLVAPVPEKLVAGIRRGSRVMFTVPAYPAERFAGVVARPAQALAPETRTMPVELDVANSDGRLAPGMYAEVAWPMARGGDSLVVPRSAIKATTERIFVIRVVNGTAEWVDVRRGAQDGDLVEVIGDLKPGDRIVQRATDEIRPGAKIAAR
ncbi:MAG: efflux RND transporter periplasmic adaptor subunit, partial [Acidobacteria bacterium]|nr:efflux RND transporter periplasmic adaptor subunit [Acidobacteriota bacterium]